MKSKPSQVRIKRIKGVLNTSRYIIDYKNICIMSECVVHHDHEPNKTLYSICKVHVDLRHFIRHNYHRDIANAILKALEQFYQTKEEYDERRKLGEAISGRGISLHSISRSQVTKGPDSISNPAQVVQAEGAD